MTITSFSDPSVDFSAAFNAAFNNLNKGALGVWLYIYTNHPKDLVAEKVMESVKISRASFYHGITELQAKNYLILQSDGTYAFNPVK